ncbi:hypothetical protein SARC_05613 [Sphaeroforma arctica JP610]|uniref:Uncharacterized protein n=1 Tax=Sphaeroforma arctica JP610 TaxID=667725 RepID=A0A0L0G1Q1_9EUKA|nr:hypothetical protein SARC_05613 [Sphaeroforma arctica JP610]KNC82103.1 hypothetical protein SARC_05613 [Sphaeroforma arctica JP610]|eukprot:XP_014156005.1 hypothetical protein SARC_05613 [Sphaeroforma arctica JP610]
MPTATRAGVYGGDGDDTNMHGMDNRPAGEPTPGRSSSLQTSEGVPIQASAMQLEIDKSICQGNYFLASRFISKLEATAPVAIASLHKMRVGIYDQQHERRIPLVNTELRKRYDQCINACGDDDEDEVIQISQSINELEIMRSRLGYKVKAPALSKLLKTSKFSKLLRDSSFKMKFVKTI